MSGIFLGIDMGSTTTKLVVVDEHGTLLDHHYVRSHGRPRQTLLEISRSLPPSLITRPILGVGLTGSGGGPIAKLIGGFHLNELVAQARSVGAFHRETRTVIEIGGQDSKLLSLRWDEHSRQMVLLDFAMNALCAAGTGSFLDQQAERLGISIENDFARIALTSENPARIAGRCTVFAKSDMIHLQQEGVTLADILAGLCHALARNFKSVIGKGRSFTPPILFQGGVAYNGAVLRAFESVLGCRPGDITVPEHHCLMAALGAAYAAIDEVQEGRSHPFRGFEPLEESIRTEQPEQSLPPLRLHACACTNGYQPHWNGDGRVPAYLGIDVGSISTCLAVIDEENHVLAKRYLMTGGNPLEAVRRGLVELRAEVEPHVRIAGAGATGSGRYLTGHFIGADVIRNEITAQARAAVALDPEVDTIFEIGGQDSKYIRLHRGAVIDFAMNNACAAGTGSFLEEQADRLGISITDDFSRLALQAPAPTSMGERCTVFMESDLVHHQQRGASVENLTAGLAYAIVQNYLNRVVNGREVGNHIYFQGGVASNASVAAAFEQVLGRPVTVPAYNQVTGAIGAAILAREEMQRRPSGTRSHFRGFDLENRRYDVSVFTCQACPNICEVRKIEVQGQPPIFYGARCDKFEEAGRSKGRNGMALPDLFAEREEILLDGYTDPGPRCVGRKRVGIPRGLIFYDMFPYWHAFFDALGMDVILSTPTNRQTVVDTQNHAVPECCFPVRLMYGHAIDLMDRDLDYIFLPSVLDRENLSPGQPLNHYCPLIPAVGQMIPAHLDVGRSGARALTFPLHLAQPKAHRSEFAVLARQLGIPNRHVMKAAVAGAQAQANFYRKLRERGRQVLDDLKPDQPAVVLIGRPYNTCDSGVCQELPLKLRKMGALPIPIDFLPVEQVDLTDAHSVMYWRCGQDILAAARLIRADDRLQAIYLTSFDCGPDSFLISFFRRIMDPRPFLELEVDDHTADAGILTRCEAFLDSLNLTVSDYAP